LKWNLKKQKHIDSYREKLFQQKKIIEDNFINHKLILNTSKNKKSNSKYNSSKKTESLLTDNNKSNQIINKL